MTLEHHLQKLIWQAADPANPSFRAAFERDQGEISTPPSPGFQRFATDDADPEIAKRLGLKSKSSPRHRGTA